MFIGDGDTLYITPLLNILVSGKNLSVAVLELVECQGRLEYGGGKDGIFICRRFLENTKTIDPDNFITDVVMFDGASNVQLGGFVI